MVGGRGELFYSTRDNELVAVTIDLDRGVHVGLREVLFRADSSYNSYARVIQFGPGPAGQGFLAVRRVASGALPVIVLNPADEVLRLLSMANESDE